MRKCREVPVSAQINKMQNLIGADTGPAPTHNKSIKKE